MKESQAESISKTEIRDFTIEDLKVGMFASYDTILGEQQVLEFANLVGDISPLHVDKEYVEKTSFETNIVHGMLAASHFSTLVGVFLPGQKALLSEIQIDFKKPIPVGSIVTVSGKITFVSKMSSAITLGLVILFQNKVCISGKATVTVR